MSVATETTTVPNIEWKPHRKQEYFLRAPDSIKEILFGGAAGAGKTECLYMIPVVRGFFQDPRYKGIILRRNFTQLEREIIIRSRPIYSAAGGRYNEQKKIWTFPSGAKQLFGHAENEKDILKYDGDEYNYVGFDEGTHFTEFQYRYMLSRVRSSSSNLPAIVRTGSNPGNVGHKFFRTRFVDPCVTGNVILVDKRTGLKRMYLPAKATDNPTLMKNNPDYLKILEELPTEAEIRAKRDGDWYTYEGQVFDLRIQRLPDEPPNALHICEPFEIPFWWPKIAAIDWGFAASLWIGWAAIAPNGRVYIYREYMAKRQLVSDWAAEFARLSANDNLLEVHLDPSAWQKRGVETIDELFRKYSGYTPVKAINDRIGGKMLMHDYLRWQPKPITKVVDRESFDPILADKIHRMYGSEKYQEYLRFFDEEMPETDLPKLQIFSNVTGLPDALSQCVYDENNPEDVAEFDGDDPYDGGRYLIQAVARWKEKARREGKKYEALQHLENYLKKSDQTQFYIHAPRLLKENNGMRAVKLRRRRR